MGFGRPLKSSARNFALCPDGGRFKVVGRGNPILDPSRFVSSKVTSDGTVALLATAKPLWMFPTCPSSPEDSTYIRNALPLEIGTPASDTIIPKGLYEKTANGVGATPSPFVGTMRT